MFSRIFGGNEGNEEGFDKRKKQIDTLKVFNDKVSEIIAGDKYQVDFTAGGGEMALLVTLPPKFPLERPLFKVSPAIAHPWVDNPSGEITRAPGLINFSVHSDLGRVVQAIIRELSRHSTHMLAGTTSAGVPSSATPAASETEQSLLQCALARLSVTQLQQLEASEDLCDELIEQLPPLRTLDAEIERLTAENEQLAREAVTAEPLLERLRLEVGEKASQAAGLRSQYEQLSHDYQSLSDKYTPVCIKEALREAATLSDQQSEKLAEKFLAGEIDADLFLESYINKRMLSHGRRVKEEKLHRQLQELERAGY